MTALEREVVLGICLAFITIYMQGCSVTTHSVPAWMTKPDYVVEFSYIDTSAVTSYNSCHQGANLTSSEVCNGHGTCTTWSSGPGSWSTMFCACDRAYADPECRTRRKSQITSYILSVCLGYFGADLFYLDYYLYGAAKLATLGGFGIWWIIDIVRTGSAPVFAWNGYRVAHDLPHWVFVLTAVGVFALVGYLLFTVVASRFVKRNRTTKMLMEMEDEFFLNHSATAVQRTDDRLSMPRTASHRMPYPAAGYGTQVPDAVKVSSFQNPNSSYCAYGHHV